MSRIPGRGGSCCSRSSSVSSTFVGSVVVDNFEFLVVYFELLIFMHAYAPLLWLLVCPGIGVPILQLGLAMMHMCLLYRMAGSLVVEFDQFFLRFDSVVGIVGKVLDGYFLRFCFCSGRVDIPSS